MREYPDRLPDHAPVLVDRLNTGHRRDTDGAVCGTAKQLVNATAIQCHAWSVLPCPTCWPGRQPW